MQLGILTLLAWTAFVLVALAPGILSSQFTRGDGATPA